MRESLERLIARFNERVRTDDGLREELGGLEKTIQVVTEKQQFHMTLRDGEIGDLEEGQLESADLSVLADEETLRGVFEGRIPPFKALATGKLKIKASLEDALRFRKLLS
ncbi:MAG: SCP2 sterol-binding domain-containing protein [Thermoplasmata archaeon]